MLTADVVIKVDNTKKILGLYGEALRKAYVEVGQKGEKNAKKELMRVVYDTPERGYKRTGRLLGSVKGDSDDSAAYIGTNLEYAPYVELGTSKMKKRPFLKPAATNYTAEYSSVFKKYLENG